MNMLKHLNPAVAGIQPYEPGRPIEEVAREFGLSPADICKLASNENPLGASPKALRRLRSVLKETFRYPDGGAYYLRHKLAAVLDVTEDMLIFGNGSNEIIEFIGHCFMGPGRSVVVSAHAFVIYKLIARMFGSEVIEVPATPGLGHDLRAMADAIREDTSVVFVCNPNNPTGTHVGEKGVRQFMERVPESTLVVFDEAYYELCLGRMPDTMQYVRRNRACVILRTFSKAYGLAGLRIGYGIAPPPIVAALEKPRQPFNVNRLAQEAAYAALDDTGFLRRTRAVVRRGRMQVQEGCRRIGIPFVPSVTNFMLLEVGDGATVARELMRCGVIVRPMAGYGLPRYVRINYGTPEENQRLIDSLARIIEAK